jgi:hypothetical protein
MQLNTSLNRHKLAGNRFVIRKMSEQTTVLIWRSFNPFNYWNRIRGKQKRTTRQQTGAEPNSSQTSTPYKKTRQKNTKPAAALTRSRFRATGDRNVIPGASASGDSPSQRIHAVLFQS